VVPSNAIPLGALPTAKVPSVAPAGDSSVTVLSSWLVTHMFAPSKAIQIGEVPTAKVPSVAPAGDSSVTSWLSSLATHTFVPSTAIPCGLVPPGKVPRGPHVGVQAATVFLQAPAAREATGARGARQRWASGGQALQRPVAQSHAPPELEEPPVVPLESMTTLPPHAAIATSARTRETRAGRAGMAAA
jgi:hypothetical protein